MLDLLKDVPGQRLRMYIIWLPILREDTRTDAVNRSQSYSDTRLTYYWDPNRFSGITWQQVLEIDQIAWDLYFIYDAGVRWEFNPTIPDYWMRQLKGVLEAPFLDIDTFKTRAGEMLKRLDKIPEGVPDTSTSGT